MSYAKKSKKNILLLAETDVVKHLSSTYMINEKEGTDFEHFGIFGCSNSLKSNDLFGDSLKIVKMSEYDKEQISKLPVECWGNLPIIIGFIRDIDKIFLAKLDNEIVGFISYTSSYESYYDIANIKVHPSFRNKGIGKALIHHLASKVGDKIYYGSAKSIESSILAEKLEFEKIVNAKKVWHITK